MIFFHDEKREKSAIAYEDRYKIFSTGTGGYVVVTHDWRFYKLLLYLGFSLDDGLKEIDGAWPNLLSCSVLESCSLCFIAYIQCTIASPSILRTVFNRFRNGIDCHVVMTLVVEIGPLSWQGHCTFSSQFPHHR